MTADYKTADIPAKDVVMLDYAAKLTLDPCQVAKADFNALKDAEFSDAEALDIVQIVAYFNFVNRLGCGLDVELEAYWEED